MPVREKTKPKSVAGLALLKRKREEAALLWITGHALLRDLASRYDAEASRITVSETDWRLILDSGILDGLSPTLVESIRGRSVHAMRNLIARVQGEIDQRKELHARPGLSEAKRLLRQAEEEEHKAAVALGLIDFASLDADTAAKVNNAARQLAQFRAALVQAEETVHKVAGIRACLAEKAPQFLRFAVEGAKRGIEESRLLREKRAELRMMQRTLRNDTIEAWKNNGCLDPFVKIYCPSCIEPRPGNYGNIIDNDAMHKCFKNLRLEYIPGLENDIDKLEAIANTKIAEAEKPLQKWIDDGEVNVDMLTAAL